MSAERQRGEEAPRASLSRWPAARPDALLSSISTRFPSGEAGGGGERGVEGSLVPPAFVVRSSAAPHVAAEGCACPNCSAARMRSFLAVHTPRQHARRQLERRAAERTTGLSNAAYLAASSGTMFLRLAVTPSRVRVQLSDPIAESLTPVHQRGGMRGEITRLSDSACDRLADRAWSLTAEGHTPEVMVTLTSPANWQRVYVAGEDGEALEGGRILKGHLAAFRKRLGRFLTRYGVGSWSALWFLEFQQRGAPHFHLLLFGCKLPEPVRRAMRAWCGPAWSSIVGNPSKIEQQKHKRAGTQVARMRSGHFGYAVKYATKTEQKEVPHYFRLVGRFWGCWNYSAPEVLNLDFDFSRLNADEVGFVGRLLAAILGSVETHAPRFVASRSRSVSRALQDGLRHKFGFSVFGAKNSVVAAL